MYFITSLDIILTRETFLTTALCLDSFFIQIKVVPLHTESDFPLYNMSQNHNIFTTKQGKKQTNQTLQQPRKIMVSKPYI